MPNQWFVHMVGRDPIGPISDAQLRGLIASGQLLPTDMILLQGGFQWAQANSLKTQFSLQVPIAPEISEPDKSTGNDTTKIESRPESALYHSP